ncbi:hypothetical protein LX36DRAFT_671285 [Colletotrichum falcatum]|nr:hypothetical protein LX36DRAFT_671285 [Colletotrichum falcatum]
MNTLSKKSLGSGSSPPPLPSKASSLSLSPATPRRRPSPRGQSPQTSGGSQPGAQNLWAVTNLAKFLELCHKQINRGVLYNQRYSVVKEAMAEILPAMRTLNPCFTKGGMTTKYRSLLSDYPKVRTLLRPGVQYENETGKFSAPEEIWERFEERYPNLAWVRDDGFPCLNEMKHLWPYISELTIAEAESCNYLALLPEDIHIGVLSRATINQGKRKRPGSERDEDHRPPPGVDGPSSDVPRPLRKYRRVERERRLDDRDVTKCPDGVENLNLSQHEWVRLVDIKTLQGFQRTQPYTVPRMG